MCIEITPHDKLRSTYITIYYLSYMIALAVGQEEKKICMENLCLPTSVHKVICMAYRRRSCICTHL